MNLSPYAHTIFFFFTYYCHMKSHHIWQACVIGFQACWELGARTAAAPWSDSVEGRPVCHSFHSAQQPPSSFSDHKRWLVSEIPLQTTRRKQLIVITLSHGARAPFFPRFSSQCVCLSIWHRSYCPGFLQVRLTVEIFWTFLVLHNRKTTFCQLRGI